MLVRSQILIGALAATAAALAIALGVTLASADDDNDHVAMMMGQPGYPGMMGAMGSMDSAAMLQHMKEVLGEDAFNRMQQHIRDHWSGAAMMDDTELDQMMHTMMDGMLGQLGMEPAMDEHHSRPLAPGATPTR